MSKIKVSDIVIDFLASKNIDTVFGVSGGASLHLLDSVDKHPSLDLICNHHEQHSAMSADAYARATGKFGAVVATSGPGATNLITGIACSFYDSVPLLCLTGQVSTFRQVGETNTRQIGFQETPIVDMLKPITKFSKQLSNPEEIYSILEDAFLMMMDGRKGPVHIDLPDNLVRSYVEPKPFGEPKILNKKIDGRPKYLSKLSDCLKRSQRPVIIFGAGARKIKYNNTLIGDIEKLRIPVVTTWGATDFFNHDAHAYFGNFGTHGLRVSNFAVQNSDLVISIGARLDTKATGTPVNTFARTAKKVMVDIDVNEIKKFKHFDLNLDIEIESDSAEFLFHSMETLQNFSGAFEKWIDNLSVWRNELKTVEREFRSSQGSLSAYRFVNRISECLTDDCDIISDTGCILAWLMQHFPFKKTQSFYHDFNNTAMGWSLPAVTGVYKANRKREINCFVGDGSFMMSLQELSVIRHHNIPVNIYVINNDGYSMIKQTQDQWLNSSYVGSDGANNLTFPKFESIAQSFGFKYFYLNAENEWPKNLKNFLAINQPKIIEVRIPSNARVIPQTKFGRPNEDLEPLLSDEQFSKYMLIDTLR